MVKNQQSCFDHAFIQQFHQRGDGEQSQPLGRRGFVRISSTFNVNLLASKTSLLRKARKLAVYPVDTFVFILKPFFLEVLRLYIRLRKPLKRQNWHSSTSGLQWVSGSNGTLSCTQKARLMSAFDFPTSRCSPTSLMHLRSPTGSSAEDHLNLDLMFSFIHQHSVCKQQQNRWF